MDAKTKEAIDLLRTLIATPSPSRDESRTADLIFAYLAEHGAAPERLHNNVFARSAGFDPARPTLLLNSHHDTVRPAASYTRDPYAPTVEGDRLYGLGSNDAGASAVSLTQTFLTQRTRPLPFNLLLALSAEEECMGEHGMRTLLPQLGRIDMAIVGEPTGMQAAVGERGLVVLDCEARGKSGHAARNEGVNALYIALDDIARLRDFRFDRRSDLLGPIGIAVTQIAAGTHHGCLHQRGNGRNPASGTAQRGDAPLDTHPCLGAQRRPSARTGDRRHGARKLRIAHHVGHGADAFPVAQDGAGAILALAYGRRIRVAFGDRRGHRNLRKIHKTTG